MMPNTVVGPISSTDVLLYTGAFCSVLMVFGSLFLLYKGVLTFKQVDPTEALRLDFQRAISIQTRYPAIALFVIGAFFLGLSLYFALAQSKTALPVKPLILSGKIESDDSEPISATAHFIDDLGETPSRITGEIRKEALPDIREVIVDIVAPGYERQTQRTEAYYDKDRGELTFGTVKIGKRVSGAPEQAKIVAAPSLPPPK